MPDESARLLAAQVVNYLKGEDVLALMDKLPEPTKSKIAEIRQQVPEKAAEAMRESVTTREVIVGTLRMREVLEFMLHDKPYLDSDQHNRIWKILATYGPEFPEEIEPEKYLMRAGRYKKEQFPSALPE